MLTKDDIQKAIREGLSLQPEYEEQKLLEKQQKELQEIEKKKVAELEDVKRAEEYLKDLPERIKKAISYGDKYLNIVSAEYKNQLKENWRQKVFDKLKELELDPKYDEDHWEDWNSYDTGFAKHCSRYYITIPLIKSQ